MCGNGQLSLKLGKFGAFVGCSNYPECKFTRTLTGGDEASVNGGAADKPGQRLLGTDPASGEAITLRDGRFGAYVQLGEGEKPKRSSLPKGLGAAALDLATALTLLSLPREVARHPTSGEPILAGHRPLRPLRPARQDLRQPRRRRRRADDRRQPRHRPHRRQGERAGEPPRRAAPPPAACSANTRPADR